MSYYAKVSPRFWTGETGRSLRGKPEMQIVATYLITSPHANMLGFYHLPVGYMAIDTGLPIEGASEALRRLCAAGFCRYDEQAEVVWVVEMARIQIGESLEPKDKRCTAIEREYHALPNNRLLKEFFDRYGRAFHLKVARTEQGARQAPSEGASQAPSKPAAAAVTATASTSATAEEAIAPSASRLDAGTNGHDLLKHDANPDPAIERIPLCDGTEYPVPKAFRDELDRLYPAVDPDQTLREIRGWCLANPRRRKTARGVKGFITSWFSREQDKQSRRAQ